MESQSTEDLEAEIASLASEAREDLLFYAQICNSSYIPSRTGFHALLASKLQALGDGNIKRLVVSTPPRHGKSQLTSVEFTTWLLGRFPKKKIVLASYAQSLALEMSKQARARMASEEYQEVFSTRIAEGDAAAHEWKTSEGGMFKAVGVGGGLTGRGADVLICVRPNTMVETDAGTVAVKELEGRALSCKVLAYEETTGKAVWRSIQAFGSRQASGYYRITTAAGRVVEATAEHPFYTGGGYKRADELSAGDNLLCAVRVNKDRAGLRGEQAHQKRSSATLLLKQVLLSARKRASWFPSVSVQNLWFAVQARTALLFRAMQGVRLGAERLVKMRNGTRVGTAHREAVLPLREGVQTEPFWKTLLFGALCKCEAQPAYAGNWQPRMEAWSFSRAALLREGAQGDSSGDYQTRRRGVCGVRLTPSPCDAPHRPESSEQQVGEPCDALHAMSHEAARGGAFETVGDSVALVEFIREPTLVYSLSVEGTKNFFANGVLTHNCDDLFRDFQDAHSSTMRERVWNWFWSVAYTRLHPGAVVVIIMTRWHRDDIVGRLLDPERLKSQDRSDADAQWEYLNLPALAESDDPLGRKPGEALFPERYPESALASIRTSVGSYVWASLYTGNPVVRGGNYIRVDKFQIVDEAPEGIRWVRFWDLATDAKSQLDHTAGAAVGFGDDGTLYIRDVMDGQWTWPDARQRIKLVAEAERFPVGVEAVGGFKTAFQNLLEVMPPYVQCHEFGVDRDKFLRAQAWTAMVANGKVALVRGNWNMDFIMQAEAFPSGKNDDMIDAVSGGYTMLQSANVMGMVVKSSGDKFRSAMRMRRERSLIG